jgi:hypothetical protein
MKMIEQITERSVATKLNSNTEPLPNNSGEAVESDAVEKLHEVDLILAGLEDHTHGQDGNQITKARKLIHQLFKQQP